MQAQAKTNDQDNRPFLETERLLLRPFQPSDQHDVQRICSVKEIAANTRTIPHPYPPEKAIQWISMQPLQWKEGKSAIFAICTKANGKLIGAVGLGINSEDQNAELGYWIDKTCWGQGYCTEAARAVVRFGLEQLALNRVHAHYMTRNPASGRIMEKIGMKREGLLRGHVRKWGVFEDVVFYGILKSDLNCGAAKSSFGSR